MRKSGRPALDVDFAWGRVPVARMLGVVALCCAMAAAACVLWQYEQVRSDVEEWTAQTGRLQRRQSTARFGEPAGGSEKSLAALKSAQRVIDELDRPWDNLLYALESAVDDSVTLLSIDPEPEREQLRLQAEARDAGAMLDFVRRLSRHAPLQGVYLAGHQINALDAQRPVRFTVMANWRKNSIEPPASGETGKVQ